MSLGDWMEHWRYLLCAWSLSFKPVPLASYIQWFGHSHQTTFSTPWTNSNPYACLTYCLSRLVCTGFWSLHWWSNHLVGLGTQHRDLSNHFEAQSWGGWTHTEDIAQAHGREGWAMSWRLEGSHCPGISTWWLTAGFLWTKQAKMSSHGHAVLAKHLLDVVQNSLMFLSMAITTPWLLLSQLKGI